MRTLKKTLCLVLCLAMMVGLCAMATSAVTIDDYKDKDKIQYEEAVTLLSALGVLEGYPDKTFLPEGELNRAEGAAIMTRLLTKSTPTGTSSFTDMGNYAWAQPYVKFCEDYGIINGYGDGRFGPADKLTTTQFAKMLICALGYDAKKEGFVDDPAWAINVTKKVTGLNLANGLAGYNPNAPVTRETAAQLAFNTLFQTMVYSDGSSYTFSLIGGGTGYMTLKDGAPVPNTSYDYYPADPDNVMQFIEASFPEIKVRTMDDAFAVPTNYWYKGKNAQDKTFSAKKVIAETIACDVLGRYAEGINYTTGKTIYNDACFTGTGNSLYVYENGEELTGLLPITDSARVYPFYNAVFGASAGGLGGAEALLLDVDGDGVGDRLVVKYPYLAKVIAVQEDKEEETRTVSLQVYKDTKVVVSYDSEDYEKGDFVLVYAAGPIDDTAAMDSDTFSRNLLLVKDVDSKNGTLTKVTLDSGIYAAALTVGGEDFEVGDPALAVLGPSAGLPVACDKAYYELNTGMTAYLSYGYVLGVISDAEAYANYVFVVKNGAKIETDAFGRTAVYAGYVDQDAKALETVIANVPTTDVAELTWYAPIAMGSTSTRFTNGTVYHATINGLYRDTPALDTAYKIVTDANTKFVLSTKYGYVGFKGIKTVDEYDGTLEAYALIPSEGGHAIAVYIDCGTLDSISAPAAPIYVIDETAMTKELDGDALTTIYTYTAIVDGKVQTVKSKVKITLLGGYGFVIPKYDAKGYITDVTVVSEGGAIRMVKHSYEMAEWVDETLKLDEAYFVCTDTAVVYLINARGKVSKITPEGLSGLKNAMVSAISVSKDDRTLQIIYFDQYNYIP